MNDAQTTVLFLAADPSDASRLRLGQELREIRQRIQIANLRDRFCLVERMSVRPSDLSQAILDTQPNVVHFSGHGTRGGDLCLEDDSGRTHTVSPSAVASLFALLTDHVRCVVLNACFSETQARAIANHIQYVVGMKKEIGDVAAIAFSVGFYKSLAAGRTIPDAFELALVELRLLNIPEDLTPVLLRGGSHEPAHLFVSREECVRKDPLRTNTYHVEFDKRYDHYVKLELQLRHVPKGYILVDPTRYRCVGAMLDDIFMGHLSEAMQPFTYGKEWIIISGCGVAGVPWQWVQHPGKPIVELDPTWEQAPVEILGLPPKMWGKIVKPCVVDLIASNRDQMFDVVFSSPKALDGLLRESYLEQVAFDKFDPSLWRYKWARSMLFNHGGGFFVDTGKDLSPAIDRWVKHRFY